MRRAWSILTLSLLACGGGSSDPDGAGDDGPTVDGPPTPPDTDHSGTRLKRRLWAAPDGFQWQFGWYDSLLDFNCFFSRVDGEPKRCRPSGHDVGVVFRDGGCTDRIVRAGSPLPAGTTIATSYGGAACGNRVWRIGAQVTPTAVWLQPIGGGCVPQAVSGAYYEATEILDADMVPEVTVHDPAGSRLQIWAQTSDDGGRWTRGAFDPDQGQVCRPERTSDGQQRCVPDSNASESSPVLYDDTSCSQIVHRMATCDSAYTHQRVRAEPISSCDYASDFVPLSPYSGEAYWIMGPANTCELWSSPGPGIVQKVEGARIDPATLVAESTRSPAGGTTRLRHHYSFYADGTVARRGIWDTRYQVECEEREDFCVPAEYLDVVPGLYADKACTQPLADNSQPCDDTTRPGWARLQGNTFYRVGGLFTGTSVYVATASGCAERPLPTEGYLFTLEPTPVTDWETFTIVIEP